MSRADLPPLLTREQRAILDLVFQMTNEMALRRAVARRMAQARPVLTGATLRLIEGAA